MQRNIILFLLIFTLLLTSVSAQDFEAFADQELKLTPCGTTASTVEILNTREEAATYSISVDGDGSEFVTFSLLSFSLEPQQSAIVDTYYMVPCSTKPGVYTAEIYFEDGFVEKAVIQDIVVEAPDNVNASISPPTSEVITPCAEAKYTLTLHNPINFTEIYNLEVEGHPNAKVSEKKAVLEGNERKEIIVSVAPEDCTESGTFAITVIVKTEKSKLIKDFDLELIIKSTDIPVLAQGIDNIRTDYVDSTAELTIENTGDRITTYTLSVEGAEWATLEPNSISVEPGQTQSLALRLNPSEEVSKGTYSLILAAIVDESGLQYSKEVLVNIKPPTLLETSPALAVALLIIVLAILVGLVYVAIQIRKPAFRKKLDKLKARYQKYQEKQRKKAEKRKAKREKELQKKAEKQKREYEKRRAEKLKLEKKLKRDLEKGYKKQYHLTARKDIVIGKKTKNTGAVVGVLVVLILLLIAAAWKLIAPNLDSVLIGIVILAILCFAKEAARTKIIRVKKKMLLAKKEITVNAWSEGLSLFTIHSKLAVKEFKLQFKKIKTKVTPSQATYQTFELKTNADVTVKATFTVSKRWLNCKQAGIGDVKLGRYSNQRWTSIPLTKTGEGKNVVHYTAELKPGKHAIYVKVKPGKKKSKHMVWGVLAVLLIIAALILLPQPEAITKGIPKQVWKQDTTHTMDLKQYFNDPDGDSLTYSTTETTHVTIDVSGTTAYLTPETGWVGEERVRFIADDGNEGQVASNTVILRVQKQVIPVKAQPYLAMIIAVIAIILLVIAIRSQKNK